MMELPKYNKLRGKKFPRVLVFCSCILIVMLLGTGVSYAWFYFHPSSPAHTMLITPNQTFRPVVGDVHDPEANDPDITVEHAQIPGFQFQHGGYLFSGKVTDAHSRQPVRDAVVWINLPIQVGRATSNALHTVTDATGSYQFNHLAVGSYMVAASRYYNVGDGRYYAERIFSPVDLKGNRAGVVLPLIAISAPGKRAITAKQAKNVILIDLRGFYAASLLDDPLLVNQSSNIRRFLHNAHMLRSVWSPYGWRPLDQYALLTGTYPQWATYDPWPHLVPWGNLDGIDTTFWFTGGRSAHLFGQESIFDVAKGYGMQTGVIAGADYLLSDATTRNLDLLQRYSTFAPDRWLAQMEDAVLAGAQQPGGFLIYGELAPLSIDDAASSPDAEGDAYQQALLEADQTFGQVFAWLGQQGFLQNTLIVLTTSQAQANHTGADNFYGMGVTGQGTSKQALLALAGPGACPGTIDDTVYSSFIITPVIVRALGLPAPAEARLPAPSLEKGCL